MRSRLVVGLPVPPIPHRHRPIPLPRQAKLPVHLPKGRGINHVRLSLAGTSQHHRLCRFQPLHNPLAQPHPGQNPHQRLHLLIHVVVSPGLATKALQLAIGKIFRIVLERPGNLPAKVRLLHKTLAETVLLRVVKQRVPQPHGDPRLLLPAEQQNTGLLSGGFRLDPPLAIHPSGCDPLQLDELTRLNRRLRQTRRRLLTSLVRVDHGSLGIEGKRPIAIQLIHQRRHHVLLHRLRGIAVKLGHDHVRQGEQPHRQRQPKPQHRQQHPPIAYPAGRGGRDLVVRGQAHEDDRAGKGPGERQHEAQHPRNRVADKFQKRPGTEKPVRQRLDRHRETDQHHQHRRGEHQHAQQIAQDVTIQRPRHGPTSIPPPAAARADVTKRGVFQDSARPEGLGQNRNRESAYRSARQPM